jgi:hypothetical protein
VQPPFVAPPTDGALRRRGQTIALIIAVVFVCCVGSAGGLGGLAFLSERAFVDESRGVVTKYLNAIQHKDYKTAYSLVCKQIRTHTTEPEFASSFDSEPPLVDFTVGDPEIQQNVIDVPVTVGTSDGRVANHSFIVTQDEETGEFRVCGTED